MKTIISRLDQRQDAVHLRDLVGGALDDPQLQLAFPVDRTSNLFVDSRGDPVDPADTGSGRAATAVWRHGEIVACILHDAALETDPELVQAAGQAVVLALQGDRLAAELQSKTDELRASRARIVATAERERLRLERDLHDGAQQRLMSIQVKLALAQQQPPDDLAAKLEEIRVDAAAAVDELRALAHGIYPAILLERGLADAFRSLATSTAIPIRVIDRGVGRCPGPVEAAVYFCSLEAIQNAVKHAGSGARVTVTLGRHDGRIHFTVEDDGIGMEVLQSAGGVGLNSMRDRIGAVGGELDIGSAPGEGTTVSGRIPDHPPESLSTHRMDTA